MPDIWLYFSLNGVAYRTKAGFARFSVIVEAKDGEKWNQTYSMSVLSAARDLLRNYVSAEHFGQTVKE